MTALRRRRFVLNGLWLVVGLAMIITAAWFVITRLDTLLHGSPVTLALAAVTLVIGLVAVACAIPILVGQLRGGGPAERRGVARARLVLSVPALVIGVLLVATLIYVRPFAATAAATAALQTTDSVRVVDRLTWYELVPTATDEDGDPVEPTTALVFAPGARVDARAYAAVLRPLAEQGFLVCVLKEPLGLAVLQPKQAGSVIAAHPKITSWAVGGHSLGGAVISGYAQDHAGVRGLVLYASYPIGAVNRSGLTALSVSGGNDHLATPTDIDAARSDLPADTRYVVIDGGVHAFFGDYGEQPGDGLPTVDRAGAQQQISTVTREFMQSLPTPK